VETSTFSGASRPLRLAEISSSIGLPTASLELQPYKCSAPLFQKVMSLSSKFRMTIASCARIDDVGLLEQAFLRALPLGDVTCCNDRHQRLVVRVVNESTGIAKDALPIGLDIPDTQFEIAEIFAAENAR